MHAVDFSLAVNIPAEHTAQEPSEDVVGRFEVVMSAVDPGPYTAEVTATVNDQEPEQLTASVGWASQPDQEEMASVAVNRRFLSDVAESTGGHLVPINQLNSFVDDLSHSDAPLVEVWSWPIWHQWWIFCVAVGCFMTDWTIRRRQGMP